LFIARLKEQHAPRHEEAAVTPQQWIGVGVRLFAIWLVVEAAGRLFTAGAALAGDRLTSHPEVLFTHYTSLAIGAPELVAAAALWLFPLAVAGSLLPRTRHHDALQVPARTAAAVGCALIGLWVLADLLPQGAYWIVYALLYLQQPLSFRHDPTTMLQVASSLVQLGVALVLILRAPLIAGWMLAAGASSPSARAESANG
jgi:hypothetical protein